MGAYDVNAQLNHAIVRIGAADVVGAGLLFQPGRVVTCAHVVNAALRRAEGAAELPDGPVTVDFPFSRDRRPFSARVVEWSPVSEVRANDIAVLELRKVPEDCAPVPLVHSRQSGGNEFWVMGFPSGHQDGLVATGKLVGHNAAEWVQMVDPLPTGPRVRQGFSGAPVWDLAVGGVVGIVVAAATQAAEKTAWLIPAHVLTSGRHPDRVVPPALSFGKVTVATRVEGYLDVTAGGTVVGFDMDPADGLTVTVRDGRLVVALDTAVPGRRAAIVTVTTSDGRAEVPVHAIVSARGRRAWPARRRDAVRRALRDWAAKRWSVPDRLFDGDLVVRDRSVVRLEVTHVREHRSFTERSGPWKSDGVWTTESRSWARVPNVAWEAGGVTSVPVDSVKVVTCPECDEHHRVTCGKCDGRRTVKCPETMRCDVCRAVAGRQATCEACHGRGRVTCARCSGSGHRTCTTCADGRVNCPRCGASGKYVDYELEQVRREVVTRSTLEWVGESAAKLVDDDFVPLAMLGPTGLDLVPESVRERLVRWLDSELSQWGDDEVMRRVRLSVAPVAAVEYGRGATAYVIGGRVQAPRAALHGLRTLGRGRRAGTPAK